MGKYIKEPIYVSDIKIEEWKSQIALLEHFERFKDNPKIISREIEVIKECLTFQIKDEIKRRKKEKDEGYYNGEDIKTILRRTKQLLQKNEWSYAKEFIDIMIEDMSKKVDKC